MKFINIRAFRTPLRGCYDDPNETGERSVIFRHRTSPRWTASFWVAIAIQLGGPCSILDDLTGFAVECTLAQMPDCQPNGKVLRRSHVLFSRLAEQGSRPLASSAYSPSFASVGLLVAATFQANQSLPGLRTACPRFKNLSWLYGIIPLTSGDYRGIPFHWGRATELLCLRSAHSLRCGSPWILSVNFTEIPQPFATIRCGKPFAPRVAAGGFVGVLQTVSLYEPLSTMRLGVGSAPIGSFCCPQQREPVREGLSPSSNPSSTPYKHHPSSTHNARSGSHGIQMTLMPCHRHFVVSQVPGRFLPHLPFPIISSCYGERVTSLFGEQT